MMPPIGEIAEAVNLSATPCWKRILRTKKDGLIRKQVVLCDAKKLGDGAVAFVTVRTHQHNAAWLEQFATAVQQIPEIVEVYRMTGEIDTCCVSWCRTSRGRAPRRAGPHHIRRKMRQPARMRHLSPRESGN